MATGTLTQSRITLDFQPPVARLTLHHPPLNVIDLAMMDELAQALAEIEARDDVSTVLLSGAGKSFSVGVDVAAHTPDKVADMLAKFHAVIRALVNSKKVTIAAVHGHCLGGGAELAMVCDLVYTVDTASWGFPEIKLGCYPPVAATALAALVGQKHAADLILTGRSITGTEAARIGLANRDVADTELELAVKEAIQHLSKFEPGRSGDHQEGELCLGLDALRQRAGTGGENLSGRVDEDGRRSRGHQRLPRKTSAGVEGEVGIHHVEARHHARSHRRPGAGRRFRRARPADGADDSRSRRATK